MKTKQIILAITLTLAATFPLHAQVTVSTLAGSGTAGWVDGPGATAQFDLPKGITFDGSGNVYVTEWGGGGRVRQIDPAGTVSTLVGPGFLSSPNDIAFDPSANNFLFIADWGSHRVKHTDATGNVTIIAGSGAAGYLDGPAATAQFSLPSGIAVDGAGNVFVTEFGNHTVRKIDMATGMVSTVAGNGTPGCVNGNGTAARFTNPTGITVDGAGNLFVADWGNQVVRKIDPSGNVTTVSGICGVSGAVNSTLAASTFNLPHGLFVDAASNIYIAESSNHWMRKIDVNNNQVTTYAGTGIQGFADGPAATSQFYTPFRITGDCAGKIYIADTDNHRIRLITDPSALPSFTPPLNVMYCDTVSPIALTGAPSGGTFSGPGINGNSFDPALAGAGGPYVITYTYTNVYGCILYARDTTNVIACACDSTSLLCNSQQTVDLVVNGNFEQGAGIGYTSDYPLVPPPPSTDGLHCVVQDGSTQLNPNFSGVDHTFGNGTGNMLFMGGMATVPNDVWCSNVTVMPNTNYTFSAWVNNAIEPNSYSGQAHPQFRLNINGNVLSAATIVPHLPDVWVQLTLTWNSGSVSGSIPVCLESLEPSGFGNDFFVDDISFLGPASAPCPPDTLFFTVNTLNGVDSNSILLQNFLAGTINNITVTYSDPAFSSGAVPSISAGDSLLHAITFQGAGCSGDTTYAYAVFSAPCPTYVSDTVWLVGYYSPPQLVASVSNDSTVCSGSTIQLSASGGSQYSWTSSPTGFTSSQATVQVTPAITTTYFVNVSNGTCSDMDSVIVTVSPLPVTNITGPATICSGGTATLVATGGTQYSWSSSPTGFSSTQDTVQVSPTTNTAYYVTVTQGQCSSTDTFFVGIAQPPAVSITGTSATCSGDPATLTVSGGSSWLWSNGATTSSISVNPAVTSTYSVTATSAGNCTSTDSFTVVVTAYPAAVISGAASTCQGVPVELTASGGSGYSWNTGSGNATITVMPGTSTTYSVTVSNGACSDTASAFVEILDEESSLFIPNVFTPNGDGTNEIFTVGATGVNNFQGMIFNRWGELLYTWNDVAGGWDGYYKGQVVSEGTYVYTITCFTECGKELVKRGAVTVVR